LSACQHGMPRSVMRNSWSPPRRDHAEVAHRRARHRSRPFPAVGQGDQRRRPRWHPRSSPYKQIPGHRPDWSQRYRSLLRDLSTTARPIVAKLPSDQIERVNSSPAMPLGPIASAQSMHRPCSMDDRAMTDRVRKAVP
jgi:hypothetical protein